MPDQKVDQRKLGQRLCKKTVRCVNRTGRMPWIVIDGGSRLGMIDDHDRCEWVNVSSGTGSPGLSQTKFQRAVKWLCVCVTIQSIQCKRVLVQVLSPEPSVGLCVSVCPMDFGKMDDWICMPFGMVAWSNDEAIYVTKVCYYVLYKCSTSIVLTC